MSAFETPKPRLGLVDSASAGARDAPYRKGLRETAKGSPAKRVGHQPTAHSSKTLSSNVWKPYPPPTIANGVCAMIILLSSIQLGKDQSIALVRLWQYQ